MINDLRIKLFLIAVDDEYDDYIADEVEPEPEITVRDMLNVRNAEGEGYGYGEYDDYDDY